MKRTISLLLCLLMVLSIIPIPSLAAEATEKETDYTQFVDPFVCTDVDYGQLSPAAMTPYPLMKLSADTYPHDSLDHAGYDYSKGAISGFSHTRIEGVGGVGAGGDVLITPTYVQYTKKPSQASRAMNIVKDAYDQKVESASPGYYSVNLWPEEGYDDSTTEIRDNGSILAELTSDVRTGLHRYTFPKSGEISLIVDLNYCYQGCGGGRDIIMNTEKLEDGRVAISGRFSGGNVSGNGKYTMYFYMETSQPVLTMSVWDDNGFGELDTAKTYTGNDVGAVLTLLADESEPLEVKVTVSSISAEQAKRDMEAEIPDWDFNTVRQRAKDAWNEVLSKVKVTSSTASDPDGRLKKLFYTHLYHMFTMPMNATSTDGTYRAINSTNDVRVADGYTHYDSWTLWDDFKKYPIVGMVMPDVYADIVRSIADGLEAGFATWSHNYQVVPNVRTEHAVALLADGVAKGMTDIPNLAEAYEAAKKIADGVTESTRMGNVYKMVEYCYDDWCISLLAKELYEQTGDEKYMEDYAKYSERAFLYKELYRADAVIPKEEYQDMVGMGEEAVGSEPMGLLWGKNSDGTWKGGNPESVGDQGLYQGSLWQFTFWDSNDVSGLMDLMGGKDAMYRQLSYLMGEYAPEDGSRMLHTSTNEIDLHSPYLFNYVGRPWRTQYWTRQIYADQSFSSGYTGDGGTKSYLYKLSPAGYLNGMDDDAGTMAAMYVAAAMGLFPMTPGDPTFQLTSPFFEEIRLDVGNGREFVIQANNVSTENKYIQSATLNGAEFERTWLSYDEISRGGVLRYEMGSEPSTWAADAPPAPSMSDTVDSTIYEDEQIAYSALTFEESDRNDGSTDTEITITVTDETVSLTTQPGEVSKELYNVSNVPEGMEAQLTCVDGQTLSLTLSGNAVNHGVSNSIDNLKLELKDELFNGDVTTKRQQQELKIQFQDDTISYSSDVIEEQNGVFDTTITATLNGTARFSGENGEDFVANGKISVGRLPEGLTVKAVRTSDTTLDVTVSGTITGGYDDRDGLFLTFNDDAFTGDTTAAQVSGSNYGGMKAIKLLSASYKESLEREVALSSLRELVEEIEALDFELYTEETAQALQSVLAEAKALLENGESTDLATVQAMLQKLQNAQNGLVQERSAAGRLEFEEADYISDYLDINGTPIGLENADGGLVLNYVSDSNYVRFGAVDFGTGKAPTQLSVRYSGQGTRPDAAVELWLNGHDEASGGTLLAKVETPDTGSWSSYRTATVALDEEVVAKLTGVCDLYVVFYGKEDTTKPHVGNFNWISFDGLSLNAFEKIQMEDYSQWSTDNNAHNGEPMKTEQSKDADEGDSKTEVVANTFDGAWLAYKNVDFGSQAPDQVSVRYSGSANCPDDAQVELHLGSKDGPVIATVSTPTTNNWSTYATATAAVNEDVKEQLTGIQDVYVVLKGTQTESLYYIGNFNWMQFEVLNIHDAAKVEAESFDDWCTEMHPSGNGPLKTEDGGVGGSVANTFDGAWLKFDRIDFGDTAPAQVTINYKVKGGYCPEDARLEIRQGDPETGTLLATVNTPNSGSGWSNWTIASAEIDPEKQALLTGVQEDIYFVFRGDMSAHSDWYIMNLDYVAFGGAPGINPYETMEMENYTEKDPGVGEEGGDGGKVICNTHPGEWICFKDVNFGDTAPGTVSLRYSGAGNCHPNANIELYVGSMDGEPVAKLSTPPTGSWSSYQTITIALDETARAALTGQQDIYLVFRGEGATYTGNFNWMRFNEELPEMVRSYGLMEAESYDQASDGVGVEGGSQIHWTYDGAWLLYKSCSFDGAGLGEITIRYANNAGRMGANAKMLVYLDDKESSEPFMTIDLPVTSESSYDFRTVTVALDQPLTGEHDIYLVLKADTDDSHPYVAKLDYLLLREKNDNLQPLRDLAASLEDAKLKKDVQNDIDGLYLPLRTALLQAERVLNAAVPDNDELNAARENLETLEDQIVAALLQGEMATLLADCKALSEENTDAESLAAIQALIPAAEAIDADSDFATYQAAFTALNAAYESRKPIAEKQALAEALAEAKAANEDVVTYVPASKSMLTDAIAQAEAVLADDDATAAEIADAVSALERAMDALVPMSDSAGLQASVDAANALLNEGTLSESLQKLLQESVDTAQDLLDRKDSPVAKPSNSDYSYAKKELDDLMAGITEAPSEADVERFNQLVEELSALDLDGYTEESAAAVKEALELAQTVEDPASLTAYELEQILAQLEAAQAGLEADRTDLLNAMTQAQAKLENAGSYTEESVEALRNALEAAKTVYDDPAATPATVAEAVAALEKAMDGLTSGGSSSGGGSSSISSYTITVTQSTGGKISPSTSSVEKGSDKTFTITANKGYKISDVLVDGKSVGAVSSYTFKNVTARHTITAKFEKVEDVTNVGGFIDVKSTDWFAEAVQYVVDNGLMNGTSSDKFTPNGDTTRGMIVTILYRQAGSPKVESDGKTWWSDARAWAMEVGVSDGTNMDKEITREQLATMLYRYAELKGQNVSKSTSLDTFKDSDQVSSYAVEALEWAAAEGIVTGKTGGIIDPQAGTTRAETATMLMRFCK